MRPTSAGPYDAHEGSSVDLEFTKMHGLGNDFILIHDQAGDLDFAPEAVQWLCDRHFGIGADGLILVRPATVPEADVTWWFRNSDGSVAEMCGNGIRCVAKFAVDRGLVPRSAGHVNVLTSLGIYSIEVERDDAGNLATATVDMGAPILTPAAIPTMLGCEAPDDPVVDCVLDVGGQPVRVTCVSMGNPHCVVFVDDVDFAPVCTLGPAIETHPAFPNKTNVEFVQVMQHDHIRVRVWERGVGETLACGTGACAATVAAALTCRGGREADVQLPGGELHVRWSEDGHVFMTGSATEVFTGTLLIPEVD